MSVIPDAVIVVARIGTISVLARTGSRTVRATAKPPSVGSA